VEQCCYDSCGQCNPPDHSYCNSAEVCEAKQGPDGGCSGTWKVCPAPAPTTAAPPTPPGEEGRCCFHMTECPSGLTADSNTPGCVEVGNLCSQSAQRCTSPQNDPDGCDGTNTGTANVFCPVSNASLLQQASKHQAASAERVAKLASGEDTVEQCCYDSCGQCNPPDHSYCNSAEVCEAKQGPDGGCSGTWKVCPAPAPTTAAPPTPPGEEGRCCFHMTECPSGLTADSNTPGCVEVGNLCSQSAQRCTSPQNDPDGCDGTNTGTENVFCPVSNASLLQQAHK